MATRRVWLVASAAVITAWIVCGGGSAAERTPSPTTTPTLSTPTLVAQPHGAAESYVRQRGCVVMATERLTADAGWRVGDQLALEVFPGIAYTITVERVTVDINNVLSLNGRVDGEEFSSFVLSADGGNVRIRFQDYTTAAMFEIVRNADEAAATVTEIDVIKLPPLIDLPPRIVDAPASSPQ